MVKEIQQPSQYNIFQPYYLAWFSPKLYREIAQKWNGICATYLLVLLLITWLPTILQYISLMHNFQQSKDYGYLLDQVPKVTIYQGRLSFDKPSPYFIKNVAGQTLIVMDTAGTYKKIEDIEGYMLVTSSVVYIREPDGKTHEHPVKDIGDIKFGKQQVTNLGNKAIYWILVIFYPATICVSFLFRIGFAGLLSLGTFTFSKLMRIKLSYLQCLRLSVMSMTPVLILLTILELLNYSMAHGFLITTTINVLYVIFAVLCCRKLQSTEVNSQQDKNPLALDRKKGEHLDENQDN